MEELSRNSKVGTHVFWKTIGGKEYDGVLTEWDSNVARVLTLDGIKCVEC